MKKTTLIYVFLVLFLGTNLIAQDAEKKSPYQFTTVTDLEHGDVKNQGRTGTCWSFTGNSFLETEMKRMGNDIVDLSEMFTVRNTYLEKADIYVRMHGKSNFSQGGALPDALAMMKEYGALPEAMYPGKIHEGNIRLHGELESVLKGMLDAIIANKDKHLSGKWREAYGKVIDTYLGESPSEFEYEGKKYNPMSFAENVVGIDADDYVQISSTTRVPFYDKYIILVPDNWIYGHSMNVKVGDMTDIIDNAIANGYSVAWATDVSEPYFSWKRGLAVLPSQPWSEMSKDEKKSFFDEVRPEMKVTQELRDRAYDNFGTTDDHGMHIVGLTKDQNGKEYYIVKNSWDVNNPYDGYLYVSKAYVQYKTTAFLLHKDAVPSNLKSKMNF